jgi:hypothetical protein
MYPATALAATVSGLAKYICPGPLRPGKLRFWALITTCSGRVVTPGPALMHAPQLGSITCGARFLEDLQIAMANAIIARLLRSKLDIEFH